jgi:hypothetical protein
MRIVQQDVKSGAVNMEAPGDTHFKDKSLLGFIHQPNGVYVVIDQDRRSRPAHLNGLFSSTESGGPKFFQKAERTFIPGCDRTVGCLAANNDALIAASHLPISIVFYQQGYHQQRRWPGASSLRQISFRVNPERPPYR